MRNRFASVMLIVILSMCGLTLLTGCESTPKHTNVLIFGTNTKVAFDISANPTTSTPSITLGYARQEAVWMPLLANRPDGSPADCNDCGSNCLFAGTTKLENEKDTYSVIASFGANFSGSGKTGEVKAEGGLAQYFATGLAARILAKEGGDRLVSVQSADSELYAEAKKKSIEVAKERISKKDKILLFAAPNNTLDTSKWTSLIDKTDLADEKKSELKVLKDFNTLNQRLEIDAAMNGSEIEALYNQLSK